jgi:hypothetical protein
MAPTSPPTLCAPLIKIITDFYFLIILLRIFDIIYAVFRKRCDSGFSIFSLYRHANITICIWSVQMLLDNMRFTFIYSGSLADRLTVFPMLKTIVHFSEILYWVLFIRNIFIYIYFFFNIDRYYYCRIHRFLERTRMATWNNKMYFLTQHVISSKLRFRF